MDGGDRLWLQAVSVGDVAAGAVLAVVSGGALGPLLGTARTAQDTKALGWELTRAEVPNSPREWLPRETSWGLWGCTCSNLNSTYLKDV